MELPQWGLFSFWSLSHVCPLHNLFTQRNFIYLFLNVLPFRFPRIPSLPRNTNKAHKLECPSPPFCSRHWSKYGASSVTLHEQVWMLLMQKGTRTHITWAHSCVYQAQLFSECAWREDSSRREEQKGTPLDSFMTLFAVHTLGPGHGWLVTENEEKEGGRTGQREEEKKRRKEAGTNKISLIWAFAICTSSFENSLLTSSYLLMRLSFCLVF